MMKYDGKSLDFWLAWKWAKHQKHMSNVTFDGCVQ